MISWLVVICWDPPYQFAVVVDDAAMGVIEVIRGVDLVPAPPGKSFLTVRSAGRCPVSVMSGSCMDRTAVGWPSAMGSIKAGDAPERGVDPRGLIGSSPIRSVSPPGMNRVRRSTWFPPMTL